MDRLPLDVNPVVTITKASSLYTDNNGNNGLDPGDTLTYTVEIINLGPVAAENAVFTDVLDPNTTLVNGTVIPSLGTVIEGNNPGDTDIEVALGDLLSGESVTITFNADLNDPIAPDVTAIINQGFVSGDNFDQQSSDDPDTPEGDDPTSDFIATQVPTLGETALMIFTISLMLLALRIQRQRRQLT